MEVSSGFNLLSWRFLWDTQVEMDGASGHVNLCLGEVSGLETEISEIVSREESTKQRCDWRGTRETWGDLIKGTWDLLEGGRSSLPQAAKGLL